MNLRAARAALRKALRARIRFPKIRIKALLQDVLSAEGLADIAKEVLQGKLLDKLKGR